MKLGAAVQEVQRTEEPNIAQSETSMNAIQQHPLMRPKLSSPEKESQASEKGIEKIRRNPFAGKKVQANPAATEAANGKDIFDDLKSAPGTA